jgi:hypothetical protein
MAEDQLQPQENNNQETEMNFSIFSNFYVKFIRRQTNLFAQTLLRRESKGDTKEF